MENDMAAPLPTREIGRRKSARVKRQSYYSRRRTTQHSLDTFTSTSLRSLGSDPSLIAQVGNLRFLTDDEMPEGQSSILGTGAFAMVRLARRRVPQLSQGSGSEISGLSGFSNSDRIAELDRSKEKSTPSNDNMSGHERLSCSGRSEKQNKGNEDDGDFELVAVKIIEKSLLQRYKTVEKDNDNQVQVRTALENIEREIAVMKIIKHPNLVSMHEVIDTGSNRLYMVLEYLPLGEIMTHVEGTDMFKRRFIKNGEQHLSGVTADGHFDEHHAALYFVDIMHGLAYLHKSRIVHRDLKPENILLDSRGFAKIADFGVAHLFEEEKKCPLRSSIIFLSESNLFSATDGPPRLTRDESDSALEMESMEEMGKLTKTEGTWAFWSPEMCEENSMVFSGYACDIWAAGVCLYIFATGKLPFYSEIPIVLFDMIAAANMDFDDMNLSDDLIDILKKILTRDPSARAGVGDCLKHSFCKIARDQRVRELGEGVEKDDEVIVKEEDIKHAISTTERRSLMRFAHGMKSQFSSLKDRISGRNSLHLPKSLSSHDVSEESRQKTLVRLRVPRSFSQLWSRKKMSNEELQGNGDPNDGEGGTRNPGRDTHKKRNLIPAFFFH